MLRVACFKGVARTCVGMANAAQILSNLFDPFVVIRSFVGLIEMQVVC